MMTNFKTALPLTLAAFALLLTEGSLAQQRTPLSTAQAQSRLSVLSKAGAPTARPSVPVRYVRAPNGANLNYNYYYGLGYGGYGAGYGYGYNAYPGGASERSYSVRSSDDTLPGYDTQPRESERKSDSFVNY